MIETIVNSFDIWTDAQGIKSRTRVKSVDNISLEGISNLRELILELAVKGKLVSQNPNDEPASDLIKKNINRRKLEAKEGKKHSQKQISLISKEEEPFQLPNGWIWARLPEISEYNTGRTPSTKNPEYWSDKENGIPWISISDMSDFGHINESSKFVSSEASRKVFPENPVPVGTILMSFKLTIGKISILNIEAHHNEAIISINPFEEIDKDYLFKILPKRAKEGNSKNALMGNTLNATSLALLLIPIPPLSEQQRIVAKVDELMALCNTLEAEQFKNLKTHQTLVKTLLETLTKAADADELQASWERMSEHFDTLFCTEDSIEQLKQTILQLAVMGKLVKQNPNDEPASVLMKEIQKKKEKFIKNSKVKKEVSLKKITDDEIPFNIPKSWIWSKPEEFSNKITDGEHFRPETQNEGVYFLSAKDIRADGVSLDDPLFVSKEIAEVALKRCNPEKGDILIVSRGGTVGRMCTVDIDVVFCLLGSVILIKPTSPINTEYLKILMKSPHVFNKLITASGSTAQPAIYLRDLKKIIFPIAPLEEQRRIVEKVDNLFKICDTLLGKLLKSKDIKVLLSKTIIEKSIK